MKRFSITNARVALAAFFTLAASIPVYSAQQVSWVTVRDNREQAFSVEVPRGWKSFGGLFRFSVIDVRPFVDMTSPDGKINLRLGDSSVPPYSTPRRGFQQGRGMHSHQPAYLTGDQFAARYGQARFGQMCQHLRLTRSQAVQPRFNPPGRGAMRNTAGEAVFSCSVHDQPTIGYVYAETFIAGYGSPLANWSVSALGSAFAPADQATHAVQLLAHSAQSMVVSPKWSKMQHGFENLVARSNMNQAMATIRATAQMNAYQQHVIANMGQSQGQSVDHEQENFNDIINGVSIRRDPTTGQQYETPLGQGGTQWIDPSRSRAAESALSPGPGFNKLETIGR